MKRRSRALLGLLLALVMLAAACGDDGDSDVEADNETDDSEELTPVTVGVLPLADHAPLFYGIEQGFFEEEGLDIKTEEGAGGAALTPAVLENEYQFAAGNYLTLLQAREEGIGLQVVSHFVSGSDTPDEGTTALLVRQDSGIDSVEDLAGRKFAVNALDGLSELAVRSVLEENGVDSSGVEFVEAQWHQINDVLANGDADAALQAEPFVTIGSFTGLEKLLDPMYETTPSFPIGMLFASETWLEENPETANAFYRAFQRSLEAAADEEAMRETIATITDTSREEVDALPLANWQTEADEDALVLVVQRAVSYGFLNEEPNLEEAFWTAE